jgi:N-acetylmuramic acid 6-phosphate (MurNAc-6-P) etherase
LKAANEAFQQIKKLEDERSQCKDERRKREIDEQIGELSRKKAAEILKATASGVKVSILIVVGGAVCGAISPL